MKKAWHARTINDGGGHRKTVVHKYPSKEPLMCEASLICSPTLKYTTPQKKNQEHILPQQHTGIVDSGATHLYISPTAPHGPPDTITATIKIGTANGQVETSAENSTLPIPQLTADFPTTVYIMPSFTNTLIGVGPICDANYTVVFKINNVTVLAPEGQTILTGWRDRKLPILWRFALKPNGNIITDYTTTNQTTSPAHSAYNLPSTEALVVYMHAEAGLPVNYTFIKAIKKGNF